MIVRRIRYSQLVRRARTKTVQINIGEAIEDSAIRSSKMLRGFNWTCFDTEVVWTFSEMKVDDASQLSVEVALRVILTSSSILQICGRCTESFLRQIIPFSRKFERRKRRDRLLLICFPFWQISGRSLLAQAQTTGHHQAFEIGKRCCSHLSHVLSNLTAFCLLPIEPSTRHSALIPVR